MQYQKYDQIRDLSMMGAYRDWMHAIFERGLKTGIPSGDSLRPMLALNGGCI